MKTKTSTIYSLTTLTILFLVGCSKPLFHNRPSDKACMEWLVGQKILIDKGVLFDTTWVIEPQHFSSFEILSISGAEEDSSLAKVRFELKEGAKGLRVEGMIKYRYHKKEDVVQFLGLNVDHLIKLGKW
jgi:hypothetical protein